AWIASFTLLAHSSGSVIWKTPNPRIGISRPLFNTTFCIRSPVWFRLLLRLHLVAEQHVLVADVQLAVGHHRVRPGLFLGAVGLVEPAALDVLLRVGVHQVDRAPG